MRSISSPLVYFSVLAFVVTLSACSGAGDMVKNDAGPPAPAILGWSDPGPSISERPLPDLTAHSIYFDFDKSDIKLDRELVIFNWAKYLTAHPAFKVRLEGNADERGTREYNIGLGERRAEAVAQALEARGVSASQLDAVSYGKERPLVIGHDEAAWSQNRRVDLVPR